MGTTPNGARYLDYPDTPDLHLATLHTAEDIERFTTPPMCTLQCTAADLGACAAAEVWATMTGWTGPIEDSAGMWSASLPDRITLNKAGIWLVSATLAFYPRDGGNRHTRVLVNGQPVPGPRTGLPSAGAASHTEGALTYFGRFSAGTYLAVQAWTNGPVPQNITGTQQDVASRFGVVRLGT